MRKFCIVSICCLLLAGAANADTVSYSDTFGPANVPFSETAVASLLEFDPSIGTLTKVTFELFANTSSGTIAWDNEALIASDVTLGIGAEVTAKALTALTAVAVPLQTGTSSVDADNDGAADFIGTDSFSVTGGTGSDTDSVSTTVPAELALYIGTGSFDVLMSSGTETFLSTTGGYGPIDPVTGITDGTVKVTYTYIPEPATMSLLALGGLALLRRKRR